MANANSKKRILFHFMIGGTAGGSDTCLYLLLKYLDQTKFDLFLMYNETSKFVEDLKTKQINLIPISRVLKRKSNNIKNSSPKEIKSESKSKSKMRLLLGGVKRTIIKLPQIVAFVRIIKKYNIDIIHANHYLTGDRAIIIASILTKKPIISHNRGLYKPDVIDRFLVKYVDQIICMSDFSKSVYTENGIPEQKCRTIYDGIEIKENLSFNDNNKIVTIGCFGRLVNWKGQDTLVDATSIISKRVKNFKVIFFGEGPSLEELTEKVNNQNLQNYIEFAGHITDVMNNMSRCDIIVHTSIEPEPFGMVITEAMSLNKPVIATNFGGPVEIIDHEKDGYLIPPKEPEILAERIINLIENSELRSLVGHNARKKVEKKFDVEKYVASIGGIYEAF